jgi:hypothetical protein
MTVTTLQATTSPCDLILGGPGRRAAQLAAGLTIAGAATISVFFAVGEPWGTINDWTAIALAVTTLPIAIGLARRNPRSIPLLVGAASDVVGVAITTTFTLLLITRRMTFEESLLGVLGGQALIGCWLVLAGIAASSVPGSRGTAAFGMVGGAGLVTTAVVVAAAGMTSPMSLVGFVAGLIGTFGFYARLGRRPITGAR